jgi:glutamate-1-semialdehyde 2,1-aminomutase
MSVTAATTEPSWPVRHTNSEALFQRASKVIPGGVVGQGRSALPYPLYMTRARGAEIEDVDGNRYIDFHCGFGSIILGHNDHRLRETMIETLDRHGVNFSTANPLEGEFAERLTAAIPSAERVVFGCTGSEMTYHALRLARAATGRRKIVKFEGHYHGWHNEVAWSVHFDPDRAGPATDPRPLPETAGIGGSGTDVMICGYNDPDRLQRIFAEHGGEIAAIIMEPIFHNGGVITPAPGFLECCRALCDRHGAVLIFDEVITGFRHAIGGAQQIFAVTPDLTTLGKAIANGMPIAVLAGKSELMEQLSPLGDTFFSGTFAGQIFNVAVASRNVEILSDEPPYDHLFALGSALREGLDAAIRESGIEARVEQYGSVWSLYFTAKPVSTYRDIARFTADKNDPTQRAYQRFLLTRGIYVHPHYMIRGYLTAAHTVEHVHALVDASREFFAHKVKGQGL